MEPQGHLTLALFRTNTSARYGIDHFIAGSFRVSLVTELGGEGVWRKVMFSPGGGYPFSLVLSWGRGVPQSGPRTGVPPTPTGDATHSIRRAWYASCVFTQQDFIVGRLFITTQPVALHYAFINNRHVDLTCSLHKLFVCRLLCERSFTQELYHVVLVYLFFI